MRLKNSLSDREDTATVWRVDSREVITKLGSFVECLDDAESARADRFHFDKDRQRFILSRGSLRRIIGRCLAIEPSSIQFTYNAYGKPYLARETCACESIKFNVSHSGDFALIAVARSGHVGVDIEYCKPLDEFLDLAQRFFSPMEYATLEELPEPERMMAFYRCWTRKEAYIKAVGRGLSLPLDSFDVSLHPGQPPAILKIENGYPENWRMFDISTEEDYAAALVTSHTIRRIVTLNFTDLFPGW